MRRIFIGTLVVLTIALINGCANRKITRVDPNETIDLSGRWNDSDSRLVSEETCLPLPGFPDTRKQTTNARWW